MRTPFEQFEIIKLKEMWLEICFELLAITDINEIIYNFLIKENDLLDIYKEVIIEKYAKTVKLDCTIIRLIELVIWINNGIDNIHYFFWDILIYAYIIGGVVGFIYGLLACVYIKYRKFLGLLGLLFYLICGFFYILLFILQYILEIIFKMVS